MFLSVWFPLSLVLRPPDRTSFACFVLILLGCVALASYVAGRIESVFDI